MAHPTWRRGLAVAFLAGTAAAAATAGAQTAGPAARLAATWPELFPAAAVVDAAPAGERGARLVDATPAQRALGFETDDVILAVDGRHLAATDWSPPPSVAEAVFTVWRTVPGERPVLERTTLGRRAIADFLALPDSQRTAMRLAVLVANQTTLVEQGGGVVLVPAARFDSARWLAVANPLPQASEAALRGTCEALLERVALGTAPEGELAAAQQELDDGRPLEAQEWAMRALCGAILVPDSRRDDGTVAAAARLHVAAAAAERRRQAALLVPEPLLGIVFEVRADRIEAFLPQRAAIDVEPTTGLQVLGGLRVRFPVDDWPVVSGVSLLAEYGVIWSSFADRAGAPVLDTTVQQISFELQYRPRVPSRLRPFLRGGIGFFGLEASTPGCPVAISGEWTTGAVLGGGLDFLRFGKLRAGVAGSYRIAKFVFDILDQPDYEACARNTNVVLEYDGAYELDMDGWQMGVMLTFEP
jgi:hypothetical protein